MRIGVQHPFTRDLRGVASDADAFWQVVDDHLRRLAGADELAPAWASPGGGRMDNLLLAQLNEAGLVSSMAELVAAGCDVIAVACMLDPGVELARAALDVPVVGALEATLDVARKVGARIGLVRGRPYPFVERRVHALGVTAWLNAPMPSVVMPIWDYDLMLAAMVGSSDEMLDAFDVQARRLVDAGADVVVPVCVYLGSMLAIRGYHQVDDSGVPVIDPMAAVLGAATSLGRQARTAGLRTSRGPTSPYRQPGGAEVQAAIERLRSVTTSDLILSLGARDD